ncbi:MAG: 1,4-dihydroxy-2-naphthoate octaprenyltransferase [Bacteroidales bacterium]|nr:1,4-dihydroxy-2-naphthoate octaprenyltransferase [Bacteroidales bacterium]
MNPKAAFRSLRVRATPLVLSGVAMGISSALTSGQIKWAVVPFLVLTAVFLQFVSNLSNELGDSIHGTDRDDREGMRYSLQSGTLTPKDIKVLIGWCIALSCLFGLLMIRLAEGTLFSLEAVGFVVLGLLAIVAAMRYTLGQKPYGYRGLGDIYVFLFFGLAVVVGGYYLCSGDTMIWHALLPACAMGCFSVGVLNVNNIRDMKADAATRVTMAIRMGERGSRAYQTALVAIGWGCMLAWSLSSGRGLSGHLYVLTLPLFVKHLMVVWTKKDRDLDKMVPMLSISTFLMALLTFIR